MAPTELSGSMLTYAQAAERENVSEREVKTWVAEGKLPVVKYGHRTVRIAESDLDALRAAHRSNGKAVA